MKKLTNKKGFTLVEMLIVVAIIAVLAAIAIPSGMNALDKANAATDEANLRTARSLAVEKAVEIASTDNDDANAPFVYYMNMTDKNDYKLVAVDNSWHDDGNPDTPITDPGTPPSPLNDGTDPEETDSGLSKANDNKLIKVVIDKYGKIEVVEWWGKAE